MESFRKEADTILLFLQNINSIIIMENKEKARRVKRVRAKERINGMIGKIKMNGKEEMVVRKARVEKVNGLVARMANGVVKVEINGTKRIIKER